MSDVRLDDLRDRFDRRQLLLRATALGLTAPALGALLGGREVGAQEAAPSDGIVTARSELQATWIRNFNPFLSEGNSRWPTTNGVYEPLMIYNTVAGELVPWLATGYEFGPDNLSLTVSLRPGVLFSDGQPLTARDVAFTFNLFKTHKALLGAYMWEYLTAVEAVDDATARFTFGRPFTLGLYDIAGQNIVPEHLWRDVADPVTFANETPVGTGPFTEVALFENQVFELHRNPNYWQEEKPYVQGLRMLAFASADQIVLATTSGENDWDSSFIPDIEQTFVEKDPEHFDYWFPTTGNVVHLYLNTTLPVFADAAVRKALSVAVDRERISQIPMYGYTHPADATGLSDAFTDWKSEAALAAGDWVGFDVERANAELDAAGFTRNGDVRQAPDGTPMRFELAVVSGWVDWTSACQIMAQTFEEIGLEVAVQTYDFTAWLDRVQRGEFQMAIGWSASGATPFNYYRGVMSSQRLKPVGEAADENWHRFADPRADELLNRFSATVDPAEQRRLSDELQTLFVENAPAIPLFPGPEWGQYSSRRFTGFPNEENPYAILSCFRPERLIVMTTIKPVAQ